MTPTAPPTTSSPALASVPVGVRSRPTLGRDQVVELNRRFESAAPEEIVAWAVETFGGRLAMTASFADTVLVDIATDIDPDIEVIFLDTGFHFAETLTTMRRAMDRYSLALTVLRPDAVADDVWAAGSEACCNARKSLPLDRHLVANVDAWMSGLRRADGEARAATPIVSIDRRGLVKVNPLATMSDAAVDDYIANHGALVNPLHADGYASIGCWPCTEPSDDGRSGRWVGTAKTECGLHR